MTHLSSLQVEVVYQSFVSSTIALKGIDAVIDKDKTSALLGADIHCDQLIILTAIDYVYINYHTDKQQALKTTNIDTLKTYIEEEQFAKRHAT